MDSEYKQYLEQPLLAPQQCPLNWWKIKAGLFPTLARIARNYLGAPASQASSERLFSDAGNTVTDTRSKLDPAHVEEICFLHDNWELIN